MNDETRELMKKAYENGLLDALALIAKMDPDDIDAAIANFKNENNVDDAMTDIIENRE